MIRSFSCLFLCLFLVYSIPHNALARDGGWSKWVNNDYKQDDMLRPVLKDAKTPHMHQWSSDGWSPEDWIIAAGSADAVIDDLYKGGIISEQTDDDDIPVLEVGNVFMQISDSERYKVLAFLDYVYGITARDDLGMIHIEHEGTNERIGVYTKHGLQMQ